MKVKCESCKCNQFINYVQVCSKLFVPLINGFAMLNYSHKCGVENMKLKQLLVDIFMLPFEIVAALIFDFLLVGWLEKELKQVLDDDLKWIN